MPITVLFIRRKKFGVMVCIPCIVIPVLLWIFHKFIQPFVLKFWNPWASKTMTALPDAGGDHTTLDSVSYNSYRILQYFYLPSHSLP